MKRISASLFAGCMALALILSGCGQSAQSSSSSDDAQQEPVSEAVEEYLAAISPETAEASGICGANLTWYYQDHVLFIEGSGPMTDYSLLRDKIGRQLKTEDGRFEYTTAPWSNGTKLNEQIRWIFVGEGVTSIGDHAFSDCMNLSKLVLPSTLTEIGDYAVDTALQLHTLVVPASVQTMGTIQCLCFNVLLQGPPPQFTHSSQPPYSSFPLPIERSHWFEDFEDRPCHVYYTSDEYEAVIEADVQRLRELQPDWYIEEYENLWVKQDPS